MTIEKHILPSLFALLALGSGTAVAQSETVFYGQLKIGIVKATTNFGREMGKKNKTSSTLLLRLNIITLSLLPHPLPSPLPTRWMSSSCALF